ncbi:type II toxin-antitoxin system HicA family toxin [Candidatus Micrarchaeota archaeon]|nr:type II toxin-antitoxin system HicA family toxin [Candidatus Micrarchaeota archaeon]
MDKLPVLSAKELLKILSKLGYYPIRQRGSHITLSSSLNYPQITVPFHKEIAKGTLRAIIREIGISREEFMKLIES